MAEAERVPFEEIEEVNPDEVIPEPEPPELSAEDAAWEERARKMGWRPLADWRGDPKLWRGAREFVERGENTAPILSERLHSLERKYDAQGRQLTEANTKLKESGETLTALYKWAQRADERAYARAVEDLKAKQRAAVADANTEAYDAAQREIATLEAGRGEVLTPEPTRAPPPPPPPPEPPAKDPVLDAWVSANADWWYSDPEMQEMAVSTFGVLERTRPQMSTQHKLDEVLSRIKRMYPDKFANPRRRAPPAVNEPGGPNAQPRNKAYSYEDLPKEEKTQCDKFVRTIPGFTREAYVKEYVRQNGDGK